MSMTQDVQDKRKKYEEPKLVEWGTISKITQAGLDGIEESLSGTNPTFAPPWVTK
jgi:hypothetical protein